MATLANSMLGTFYSPADNLMFLSANWAADLDLATSAPDFGHTSKALWMMRWASQMLGDRGLFAWTSARARQHLDRAFLADDGSWAGGVLIGGAIDKNKNWWVYDEIDQLSGTMALADVAAGRYLPQTNRYWFQYFVDHTSGEVWNGVDYGTNAPNALTRKPGSGRALTTISSTSWWATSLRSNCSGSHSRCTTPSQARWTRRRFTPTIFRRPSIRCRAALRPSTAPRLRPHPRRWLRFRPRVRFGPRGCRVHRNPVGYAACHGAQSPAGAPTETLCRHESVGEGLTGVSRTAPLFYVSAGQLPALSNWHRRGHGHGDGGLRRRHYRDRHRAGGERAAAFSRTPPRWPRPWWCGSRPATSRR